MKRSLYQCLNAKVPKENTDGKLHCSKGHPFPKSASILGLMRGEPFNLTVCQICLDYDEMGTPIPKDERGWIDL